MYHTKKSITRKLNHKTLKSNKSFKSTSLLIGCHASISPSVLDGIKYVESIGGNAVQIFLGSNRSASMKMKTKFTPEDITEIKSYVRKNHITLIIHSIYLLNFCSFLPSSGRIRYQHDNLQHDLKYGAMIGAKCVVLHLGFKKDLTMEEALKNLISNVNYIIRHMPKDIMLSIETSAGRGSEFGYSLEALELLWKGIKHNNKGGIRRVGFCIDTAHIFVSGYDISKVEGDNSIKSYLDRFNKLIGWKNIINFHINDSRYPLGARKDEHRGIGSGLIYNTAEGKKALKYIKKFCMARKIPMILETHGAGSSKKDDKEGSHKGAHGYEYEIEMIKEL
jgi:deoxyribonuclease-4